MGVPSTPVEWLPVLLEAMDAELPRIRKNQRYASGQPDLPEMGHNLRASWKRFQKKSITDFGGLAVSAFCDRLRLQGPEAARIGSSMDHPALSVLRRIMRDNRVQVQVQDAVRDAEETGRGYLVAIDDYLLRASPLTFYAEPDPLRPWKARAAVFISRDDVAGKDYATVIANWRTQTFVRSASNGDELMVGMNSGRWVVAGAPVAIKSEVPVAIFERAGGHGLIEAHHGVIDRINLGKLQRLVTTAMQAFKQRAIKPGAAGEVLPDEDEDGNAINWGKILEPAPGALWDLPVPIDIWESAATDIRPLLEGEKQDIRDFGAVSGVPIMMLMPEQNTATGAAQIPMQFVLKARAERDRFKPALDVALVYALRNHGVELDESDTVDSLWDDPEFVTLTERFAAAVQAKGAGVSERTIKRDILGMSPDQIQQDESDVATQMLTAALMGVTGNADTGSGRSAVPSGAADTPRD